MLVLAALGVLCLAAGGCGPEQGEHVPLATGDVAVFRAEVQPLLEARCANPSCHGGVDRPLEVYAPKRHRLNPDEVYLDGELTDEELELNQWRAACFIGDLEHGSSLARKPLPVDEGGAEHSGGVIFESADDPEYLPLRAWVEATERAVSVQGVEQ